MKQRGGDRLVINSDCRKAKAARGMIDSTYWMSAVCETLCWGIYGLVYLIKEL